MAKSIKKSKKFTLNKQLVTRIICVILCIIMVASFFTFLL